MRAIFGFMGIPFSDSSQTGSWRNIQVAQHNAAMNLPQGNTSATGMPDVTGMGLKDAVYLLENKGLKIAVQGKGKVISQSIPPTMNFVKGQSINLFLN